MSDKESSSLDIFGIKPIGDAANKIVGATLEAASAFLSRICLPAAEEFGLLLRDRVHHWRTRNLVAVLQKAEKKLTASHASKELHANPRILSRTLEEASWIDDESVQEMWSGLLASSCTPDGKDESNLFFISLLSQLTSSEVKILKLACENTTKFKNSVGLVGANDYSLTLDELKSLTGISDIQRLDRELDHMRSLGLLAEFTAGFRFESTVADLTPSSLALHLYIRSQGINKSPVEFFNLEINPKNESAA
jgi:hypothetical protein